MSPQLDQAHDIGELVACIVVVRDAACRRRDLIIDADGTCGLSNRESNDRRSAKQHCRPTRDCARTTVR